MLYNSVDQNILYDHKWHKLLKRSSLFRYFPFIDFVLVAGSMALGDVHENSDFDVIVGTKYGRLYTARFFCLATYKILRWRRKVISVDQRLVGVDPRLEGFCFNHFVTEKTYCLRPPYNLYWQELYSNLVPILGNEANINKFFISNIGLRKGLKFGESEIGEDLRFRHKNFSRLKTLLEKLLSGKFGDWTEETIKKYQHKKIEQSFKKFPPGYKPRLIYDDKEVELHLDTRRLETIKNKKYVN